METQLFNKHILLIDDDAVSNMINTKIIKKNFNISVSAQTSAKDALNQFKQWIENSQGQLPDTIFLDVNMPVMDGWDFLDEFEKFPESVLSGCKVYMLTSSIDVEDIEKSKRYKTVHEFISKPLTPEKLKMLSMERGN